MTVETATFISQLNPSYPASGDPKSEGDNHLQLIKAVLQGQFTSLGAAAVTATAAQLNHSVGVTSAIQTQLDAKSALAGSTYTGTHTFSGATVVFGTPAFSAPTLPAHAATKEYADGLAFASVLPGVSSVTKGKSITNDGATASWGEPALSARSLYFATMG